MIELAIYRLGLSLRSTVFLLILLVFAASVQADYLIDDSNTTIMYSNNPGIVKWVAFSNNTELLGLPNGTSMVVNSSDCYNDTL